MRTSVFDRMEKFNTVFSKDFFHKIVKTRDDMVNG